jgi:hypothetical protein
MLEESQNKMIDSSDATNKEIANVTIKAVSASMNEYHFPGVPNFLPMSVRSTTIEEATEIWKIRRQPTQPAHPTQAVKTETEPVKAEIAPAKKETKIETK